MIREIRWVISADGDWLVGLTEPDVHVAWLVHAVGGGQNDVFIEDGSTAEPSVVLAHQESLRGRGGTENSWHGVNSEGTPRGPHRDKNGHYRP